MSATLRITWLLLLSTSFLFHIVSANDQNTTPVTTKDNSLVTVSKAPVSSDVTTLAAETRKSTLLPTNPASVNLPATTAKPTDKPANTQPSAITPKPSATPTQPSAATTKPSATPTQPSAATTKPSATPTQPSAATSTPSAAQTQPSAATTKPSAATTKPSAAATKPSATIKQPSATTKQPSTTPVPNNQATNSIISAAPTTQPNKITRDTVTGNSSLSKTLNSAATTDSSSGVSVVSSVASTIQTIKPPVPGVVLANTGSPVTQPGGPGNVGTTKPTKTSTDASDPGQKSKSHTTIISKTSQQGDQGGSGKTTMTITNQQTTASKAPGPAGNTGTTNFPSTLTKSGPPAGGTSGTRTGTTAPTIPATSATLGAQLKTFVYSLNTGQEKDEKHEMVEVCKRLMVNLQDGNCTLTWRHHNDKVHFDYVAINGKVKTNLATQIYEEINKKPMDSRTLIAILASCGALLIMIVILAVCASHHRKPYNENQQHLTEELHTVENGYHDNPTLEVMEVQPEMQEKKMAMNGEFNDSWIVPIDNLLKDDVPDEEDTHL